MRKVLFFTCLVVTLATVCWGQDSIPYPPGLPTAQYYLQWEECVGDYDGDGTMDVASCWSLCSPGCAGYICIYSYSKGSYLLQAETPVNAERVKYDFGDINNDKKIEVLAGRVIYKYSSSISKKKA
jgi:hypothetical protein